MGDRSAQNMTTGSGNCCYGYSSGSGITTGSNNTYFGMYTGQDVNTSASNNTLIGKGAGYGLWSSTPGYSNNVFVGYEAGKATSTGDNQIILGSTAEASAITVDNEVTLGNSSIATLRCQVQTISSLSDRRDKKDIEELPVGLDFINDLKPVKFTWNMRDGAKVGVQEAGFVAQDLDKSQQDSDAEDYLSLVLKNNPDKLEASYGKLVPVLVKAVQELSQQVEELKEKLNG